MAHADSIKDIYNGLVHKYQFDQFAVLENQSSNPSHHFSDEKPRYEFAQKLAMLGHIAHDLCLPELADNILYTADQLDADGVPPMPM
ncbi:hypothetical protein [Vibrio fluvialis]|uniref:hypothetical protein n=1 Tax=Vibrio fluvialis TaxID=676 RepID=UPI001302BB44|nr:hypothetical protein [Vibrio fluvialis]MCE7661330.1 hypothetical protein [Vibrio fluvialis]